MHELSLDQTVLFEAILDTTIPHDPRDRSDFYRAKLAELRQTMCKVFSASSASDGPIFLRSHSGIRQSDNCLAEQMVPRIQAPRPGTKCCANGRPCLLRINISSVVPVN